jgi:hypothetical protein
MNREQKDAFEISCGTCVLSAEWLPDTFVPQVLKDNKERIRFLVVRGDKTPSGNIKYLPAQDAVKWLLESGLAKSGKKTRVLVPSSGNFLISFWKVLEERSDELKELGIEIEIIGVVSSKLPVGKRHMLEEKGIILWTEFDLARLLDLPNPGEILDMLREYSRRTGIPVMDQYDCDWNWMSYLPIPTEVARRTQVSLFVTTEGTKGKHRIGVTLGVPIVAAFPYPGQAFPGGRNEVDIEKVTNPSVIEPIRRRTALSAAYDCVAQLLAAGIPGGITLAAELETALHFLLERFHEKNLHELRCTDGSIVVLLVCSDGIDPYIDDVREHFRLRYRQVLSLRA